MADDGGEEDEDDDEEEVAASVERAFSVRIHPNVRQLSHGPVPDASGHRLAQSTNSHSVLDPLSRRTSTKHAVIQACRVVGQGQRCLMLVSSPHTHQG